MTSLFCFVVGIFLSLALIAYTFESISSLYHHWRSDVALHNKGTLPYDDLLKNDDKRTGKAIVDRILGYGAIIAMILGFGFGLWSLFTS